MKEYDPALDERPYFVAANKLDEVSGEDAKELVDRLTEYFKQKGVRLIASSALTEEGIPQLVKEIISFTKEHPRPESNVRLFAVEENTPEKSPVRKRTKIQIITLHGGGFRVLHHQLEDAAERYDFSQEENAARFTRLLRKYKVEELLEAAGAIRGDTIAIGYKEFEFYPDYYPDEMPQDEDEPEELNEAKTDDTPETEDSIAPETDGDTAGTGDESESQPKPEENN